MELRFGRSLAVVVVVVGRLRGVGVECSSVDRAVSARYSERSRLSHGSRGPRSCDLKDRVVLARSVVIAIRSVGLGSTIRVNRFLVNVNVLSTALQGALVCWLRSLVLIPALICKGSM
jgi:hypothetical protein